MSKNEFNPDYICKTCGQLHGLTDMLRAEELRAEKAESEIKDLELYVYQSLHVSQASKLSKDNKIRIWWERGQKHFDIRRKK